MFKQLFIFLFVVTLSFVTVAPRAEAVDISSALKRMDAIITEMQSLRAEFASLVISTGQSTPSPTVQGVVAGGILGDDLAFGSTNNDIKKIQALLATDPAIYPYGVASGFFGPKTQEAIRMFQSRFDLDTVGVIGPSTRALLEVFFATYPDGKYPSGILAKTKPAVATPITAPPVPKPVAQKTKTSSNNNLDEIEVLFNGRIARTDVSFDNGDEKRLLIRMEDDDGDEDEYEDEVIENLAKRYKVSESEIEDVITFVDPDSSSDSDEDDADDALNDADDAIRDAEDEIEDADDDGDDVDWAEDTLDEAKDLLDEAEEAYDDEDYDEAVDLAEEAEELADDAIDRIDEEE